MNDALRILIRIFKGKSGILIKRGCGLKSLGANGLS